MVWRHLFAKGGAAQQKEGEWEAHRFFATKGILGKGKYSTVYLVRRLADGQLYSLKQTDITALSAKDRMNIVNEIRLLASLEHPALLRYYEAFCERRQLCLVTEHMAGGDLGALIDKRHASGDLLSERQVWSYFLQIALGLRHLHRSRILHRDLKPQNILISQDGLLKIADLGISQVLDSVFTRALVGTPYYLAPEQWRRQPYSFSADAWALGCILYELCALEPLFAARSHERVKSKVLAGMLGPLPSRYSLDLWDLLRMLLNPDPAARPTLDEIFELPAVRAHIKDLPEHLAPFCDPAAAYLLPPARLLKPLQVTADWHSLNTYLPPARYASGPAVVDSLRMRHSSSCPHLAAAAAGGEDSAHGGALFGPAGATRVAAAGLPGAGRRLQEQQGQGGLFAPGSSSFLPFSPAAAPSGLLAQPCSSVDEESGGRRPPLLRRNTAAAGGGSSERGLPLRRAPSSAAVQALARCRTLHMAELEAWRGSEQGPAGGSSQAPLAGLLLRAGCGGGGGALDRHSVDIGQAARSSNGGDGSGGGPELSSAQESGEGSSRRGSKWLAGLAEEGPAGRAGVALEGVGPAHPPSETSSGAAAHPVSETAGSPKQREGLGLHTSGGRELGEPGGSGGAGAAPAAAPAAAKSKSQRSKVRKLLGLLRL